MGLGRRGALNFNFDTVDDHRTISVETAANATTVQREVGGAVGEMEVKTVAAPPVATSTTHF